MSEIDQMRQKIQRLTKKLQQLEKNQVSGKKSRNGAIYQDGNKYYATCRIQDGTERQTCSSLEEAQDFVAGVEASMNHNKDVNPKLTRLFRAKNKQEVVWEEVEV